VAACAARRGEWRASGARTARSGKPARTTRHIAGADEHDAAGEVSRHLLGLAWQRAPPNEPAGGDHSVVLRHRAGVDLQPAGLVAVPFERGEELDVLDRRDLVRRRSARGHEPRDARGGCRRVVTP